MSNLIEERRGYVPNVVFTCGALVQDHGATLRLSWGAADTVMCTGTAEIDALVALCRDQHRPLASREHLVDLTAVPVDKPDGMNVIVGQAHFIKTVDDLHEALVGTSPHLRFGIAFCEASGPCLIRRSGNDDGLVELADRNAEAIGAGHAFVVFLEDGYPVNVLNAVRNVPEVCGVFCATANPVEILVAETDLGRGIVGIVDGLPPAGVETDTDVAERRQLLRTIGYKL